jgi:hypothetical protein
MDKQYINILESNYLTNKKIPLLSKKIDNNKLFFYTCYDTQIDEAEFKNILIVDIYSSLADGADLNAIACFHMMEEDRKALFLKTIEKLADDYLINIPIGRTGLIYEGKKLIDVAMEDTNETKKGASLYYRLIND